jgi:hypothetical protein
MPASIPNAVEPPAHVQRSCSECSKQSPRSTVKPNTMLVALPQQKSVQEYAGHFSY